MACTRLDSDEIHVEGNSIHLEEHPLRGASAQAQRSLGLLVWKNVWKICRSIRAGLEEDEEEEDEDEEEGGEEAEEDEDEEEEEVCVVCYKT